MSLSLKIKKDFGSFSMDIALEAGNETLALLGASGSGKSMTLKCVAGIVTPDEGYIILNGKTLFDSEKGINLPPQQRQVGLLFQNYALFPNMTVVQNIMAGMNFQATRAEKQEVCRQMIEKFYLNGLERRRPAQLSGGQQQRVALARILASRPQILMLDEPFSALDSFLRWELEQELLRVLEDFDGTSLLVSHNRDEVYRISDHIAVVKDGRIDAYSEKEELFRHPTSYESALLTGCKNFSRADYVDAHHVTAADWGVTLRTARTVPTNVRFVGLRPHFFRPAQGETENLILCPVQRSIDNLTDQIVLTGTPGGSAGHSQLYLRLKHPDWDRLPDKEHLTLYIPPESILILDH